MNTHECEFSEPDIAREQTISTAGTEYENVLGVCQLIVKISKAPLEDELRGIAIVSDGIWHETTLAGCEKKPFAEYIFGTFDVAALSRDQSAIPPFDMSRSMKLNPRNEVVSEIIRFIGINIEAIRKDLERQDRERRQGEEQKRLQQQGSKIAELINNHFKEWRAKLRSTMAKAGTGKDLLALKDRNPATESGIIFGDELPGAVSGNDNGENGPSPGSLPRVHIPKIRLDENSADKVGKEAKGNVRPAPSGGFDVEFAKIGVNEKRAKYDKETRTIYVNLEHPRIAVEISSSTARIPADDPNFVRMAYEIAFTEYAIVLAQELSAIQYYYDPQDALVEVRQTLDDLSKAFAKVWTTSL